MKWQVLPAEKHIPGGGLRRHSAVLISYVVVVVVVVVGGGGEAWEGGQCKMKKWDGLFMNYLELYNSESRALNQTWGSSKFKDLRHL